ncbi:MAG: hypothetical protein ACP5O6_08725 [Candidatus Baltobacteraceae bacterium]
MTFFRGLSMRLPGIVGILFLVYIGALLFAPHPSGWEKILRNVMTIGGLVIALVVIGGALAILAKGTIRRIGSAIHGTSPMGTDSSDAREVGPSAEPGFLSKFATGVDGYIIDLWDGSFMVYWYAMASAYETYNMLRTHSYLYAAYSFVVFAILAIDAILKLEKQAGFVNRLWFGYFFLAGLILTACVDGSTPANRPNVVFDVLLFFGAFAFSGFYGHLRSRAISENRASDVIPLEP